MSMSLLALCALVLAEAPADRAPSAELTWSAPADIAATVAEGASWVLSETLLKRTLAPPQCRWCATNSFDLAVRSAFVNSQTGADRLKAASLASDVLASGLVPVLMLGLPGLLANRDDGSLRQWPVDALLILEASLAAQVVNQGVKFAVGRERPFVAQLTPDQKAATADVADNNLSFYSGHTTWTFALATSAGTVMYLRNHRLWWLPLAVGLPLALTTGLLRMAADKHYATDVLVGALVGAGIGFSIPFVFHRRVAGSSVTVSLSAAPGGLGVSGQF